MVENVNNINKKYLRQQTFWDVDFEQLDVVLDKSFIVSRTVQKGSDLEILYLNSLLGYSGIYNILKNYQGVNHKVLTYYKLMAEHDCEQE